MTTLLLLVTMLLSGGTPGHPPLQEGEFLIEDSPLTNRSCNTSEGKLVYLDGFDNNAVMLWEDGEKVLLSQNDWRIDNPHVGGSWAVWESWENEGFGTLWGAPLDTLEAQCIWAECGSIRDPAVHDTYMIYKYTYPIENPVGGIRGLDLETGQEIVFAEPGWDGHGNCFSPDTYEDRVAWLEIYGPPTSPTHSLWISSGPGQEILLVDHASGLASGLIFEKELITYTSSSIDTGLQSWVFDLTAGECFSLGDYTMHGTTDGEWVSWRDEEALIHVLNWQTKEEYTHSTPATPQDLALLTENRLVWGEGRWYPQNDIFGWTWGNIREAEKSN